MGISVKGFGKGNSGGSAGIKGMKVMPPLAARKRRPDLTVLEWSTAEGPLGTYPEGQDVIRTIYAREHNDYADATFSIVGGDLPYGSYITTNQIGETFRQGIIVIPRLSTSITTTTTFNFDVAFSSNAGSKVRSFSLDISNNMVPTWLTGFDVGVFNASKTAKQFFFKQIQAIDPDAAPNPITYTLISGTLPNGVTLTSDGSLGGIPDAVNADTLFQFVVRADDGWNWTNQMFDLTILQATDTRSYTVPTGAWTNFNVANALYADGWNGLDKVDATITIDASTLIGSTSSSSPGFTSGSLPSGSTLTLINNGYIRGMGGTGGTGGYYYGHGSAGGTGGTALHTTVPLSLDTSIGQIISGGGGGGGGGYGTGQGAGGGGGGGAYVGPGGAGTNVGSPGTSTTGGAGGASNPGGAGGTGGTAGYDGATGQSSLFMSGGRNPQQLTSNGGAGGPAGNAIQGISLVTITGGDNGSHIYGPRV